MTTDGPTDLHLPEHREAMNLAAFEYDQFIALLRQLTLDDWSCPTECTLWDVRALVAHNLGNMEANASFSQMLHQLRVATKRSKATGNLMIDEMTALQVGERDHLTGSELVSRVEGIAGKAVKGRRKMPGPIRRWVRVAAPPPLVSMRLGYLVDNIYTRDVWMHRVDISRATGREMVLQPGHDGRVVSTIVCDWAAQHGQSYDLVLEGPAGGAFRRGDDGEHHQLDAVEFCRIVSGRNDDAALGLLGTKVLF
jgi:uncharacterized protein (TIGR03083 family)